MLNDRIKRARILRGMSLQEVADRLGDISKQALSKFETGQDVPNSTRLIQLARVMGVKPDYFFRPETVELGAVDFRKNVRFGAKQQESIKEQVRDHLERYLAVEDLFEAAGARKEFDAKGAFPVRTADDAEGAAKRLRAQWGIGNDALPNLIELLEEKGIKVVQIDAQDDFSGLKAEVSGSGEPVIVLNRTIPGDRQRFTAAHELGHLVMEIPDDIEEAKKELLCHRFAGAFIFPRECVEEEFGKIRKRILLDELKMAKQAYGISMQAIVRRLYELEILPKDSFDFWMKIVRRWGKKEPTEYDPEVSIRMTLLVYRALAEGFISPSRAAELLNTSLQDIERALSSPESDQNADRTGI